MKSRIIWRILSFLEKGLLRIPLSPSLPVVFITGAPRSGTTITYQYFIEQGDFCFFTNIERKYFKFPVLAAIWFRGAAKYAPTLENSYGHIPGRFSPSDGWEIFHRWFPYYYDPDNPIQRGGDRELYRTIAWFQKIYGKPFIVKNNANSLRIKELRKVFPNAIFCHVEREKDEAVDSIVKGMEKNGVSKPGLWGTGPRLDLLPEGLQTYQDKAQFQLEYIKTYVDAYPDIRKIWFDKARQDALREVIHRIIYEIRERFS